MACDVCERKMHANNRAAHLSGAPHSKKQALNDQIQSFVQAATTEPGHSTRDAICDMTENSPLADGVTAVEQKPDSPAQASVSMVDAQEFEGADGQWEWEVLVHEEVESWVLISEPGSSEDDECD
ncbi:hypothetical protein C8J56DRAFT_1051326 [Mycena floridula]|nr:hypothetical protein C8J56DRAFT_1051326 [Mycena floridula]